jgi:tRNA U38,U39,U40 pseudouridine synthase TruA
LVPHLVWLASLDFERRPPGQRCGLCGKAKQHLTKADCCGNWVCYNPEDFYARGRCLGRHMRYTLCNYHHVERHRGSWKECKRCRKAFDTEIYVWYGTNKHNFEKLEDPPSFEPTFCATCGTRINLGTDGHSVFGDDTSCDECTNRMMEEESPSEGSPSKRAARKPRLPKSRDRA